MKKIFEVAILNHEYSVKVIFAHLPEFISIFKKKTRFSDETLKEKFENAHGLTWNHGEPEGSGYPIISIHLSDSMTVPRALATLAHEASHAADFITKFIALEDKSGEFNAHSIGAVMTKCSMELIKIVDEITKKAPKKRKLSPKRRLKSGSSVYYIHLTAGGFQ